MSEIKYVPKKEVKIYKKDIHELLNDIKSKLVSDGQPSFNVGIVGSAKRNLILQRGSSPYDVDFQLYLSNEEVDASYRRDIIEKLRSSTNETWVFESKSSVITGRQYEDINKKEQISSFDIALIKGKTDETKMRAQWIEKDKKFVWNETNNSATVFIRRKDIIGNEMWIYLRKQYLDLREAQWNKDKNDKKPSYSLYVEAINNTYEHFK